MPEKNQLHYFKLIAITLAICTFFHSTSFATEMPGKVFEVLNDKITLRLNKAWVPDKGDRVTFSREHHALGTISVGEGVVLNGERSPILIVQKTKGEGEITVGTDAIVFSQSTKRVEAKKEVIRFPDPIKTKEDETLIEAVRNKFFDSTRKAIARGANVNAAPEKEGGTPLIIAALQGDFNIVQVLLDSGAIPGIESRGRGMTALKGAARKGHIKIADLLLDRGVNIDYRGSNNKGIHLDGASALSHAAAEGQAEMVTHLIARGANPNLEDFRGVAPLFYAASEGKIEAVKALLNAGVLLDRASSSGFTPLMAAAQAYGHWELAAYLLGAGANPDQQIQEVGKEVRPGVLGMTALMISVLVGDDEIFFTLLLSGADPAIKRADGKTALDLATENLKKIKPDSKEYENREIIQRSLIHPDWGKKKAMRVVADELENEVDDNNLAVVLAGLRLGVDPNALVDGEPLFFSAIKMGNMAMVELMLEHGGNPNAKNDEGLTAFYQSMYEENIDAARLLIAKGADPNILPPERDETLLHEFAENGNIKGMNLLLKAGMKPDIRDEDKETPLHKAARRGQLEAFKILLEAGADPHLKNEGGEQAIDRARDSKKAQFQAVLRNAGYL